MNDRKEEKMQQITFRSDTLTRSEIEKLIEWLKKDTGIKSITASDVIRKAVDELYIYYDQKMKT